jgi:hypothetical protein
MVVAMHERRRQVLVSYATDALQNLKADRDDIDRFFFGSYDPTMTAETFFCANRWYAPTKPASLPHPLFAGHDDLLHTPGVFA